MIARKTYTTEFRAQAVRLAREAGRAGKGMGAVAKDLGIHVNTLRDWVQSDDSEHAGTTVNTEGLDERAELEQLRKENRLLKMERESLKKSGGLLREGELVTYELIEAEKAHYPVRVLCRALGVSRAGFYAWSRRPPSAHDVRDVVLTEKVRVSHRESRRSYGSPRVLVDLRAAGERVSRKRVARLMREESLAGRRRRRFRVTTTSEHRRPLAPNLLQRQFTADAPNRAWVGDITYLWTREGWLYLAVLLDLHSRRVVGWSMGPRLTKSLALDALEMAVRLRKPPRGLVHHTDRGSQYASEAYRARLDAIGARERA